jgi:hypothetical protein
VNRLIALSLSLLLLLAAFPLISRGTTDGNSLLWWAGLGCLLVGGLIPPAGRFFARGAPEPPPDDAGLCDDARC